MMSMIVTVMTIAGEAPGQQRFAAHRSRPSPPSSIDCQPISLDRAAPVRHDLIASSSYRVTPLADGKIDANPHALAELLSLTLSLTNKLSASQAFLKHGLAISEWALLEELPADCSGMTVKKIGALMGLPPQRVKVLIAKLESRGIVEEYFAAEKSIRRYAITSAGALLKSEADMAISDMQVAMLSPSQISGLTRSSRIVRRLLKAAGPKSSAS